MVKRAASNEITLLYNALMPALAKASIGDFSGEIEADSANSRRANEILMGVEMLLEVIREKASELEAAKAKPAKPTGHGIGLLDEVLGKTAGE